MANANLPRSARKQPIPPLGSNATAISHKGSPATALATVPHRSGSGYASDQSTSSTISERVAVPAVNPSPPSRSPYNTTPKTPSPFLKDTQLLPASQHQERPIPSKYSYVQTAQPPPAEADTSSTSVTEIGSAYAPSLASGSKPSPSPGPSSSLMSSLVSSRISSLTSPAHTPPATTTRAQDVVVTDVAKIHSRPPERVPLGLNTAYIVPPRIASAVKAMGQQNWEEYVRLVELFVDGNIAEEALTAKTTKIFQIGDIRAGEMLRNQACEMIRQARQEDDISFGLDTDMEL
ncbi:uncharacterized protein BDR25DRAFT_360662 [Lindgomyces ingoldianus]|uniref:Uncharacterized protein n=1 Tax=Lindgomyces ingoldianus TaxID=673940 RepID=A0ACB6QEF8_9PLEO|nr:uncharacterized protein BDR25DRAFT_360662 [Lindgomyces ingoldianus]KAF2465301.1 hypothetical protein BDR25DRAFT_360662 [Lindgomyces ingoldianus]